MKSEIILMQGALNDDTMRMASDNQHFYTPHSTGKFHVTYWTFANEWCNHRHDFLAKTFENAIKRYMRETKTKFTEEEIEEFKEALYAE